MCVAVMLALAAGKRPVHLVHVLADDLGYNDVSWHNARIKTPTLEALVRGGVRLGHLHTWKACAPSRGATMSGRYPFHFGFYDNQDANAYGLATNFTTLPELLTAQGYHSHIVGKVRPPLGGDGGGVAADARASGTSASAPRR